MTSEHTPQPGTIAWTDLTVPDADALRDFYAAVTGWESETVSMGEYSDYNMKDDHGKAVAGICHRRGPNANMPGQWMLYIVVTNLDESMVQCKKRGGDVVDGPRGMGGESRFCVIRDPSGAVAGLYQP